MVRPTDVATFSSKKYEATVEEMRKRRESVHDRGEEVFRRTGHMDPLVRVYGKVRKSKFVWSPNDDGTFTLKRGFKRPYMFSTDGTGSFGAYVAKAFEAAPRINAMLTGNTREGHHMDFSFSVFQDRDDPHDVIQVPEFESDERFANHMRLLVPDRSGGDTPEDYDLGIWYAANRVQADLFRYGGKGIFVLLLDAPGRGNVDSRLVKTHLGIELQGSVSTRAVWQQLLTKFHGFVVVFSEVGGSADFWQKVVGPGRMIQAPAHELFAEVQSGLVYVTDNANPTEQGLYEFLRAGGQNSGISKSDAHRIWQAYVDARVPFGADPKLNVELPKPGDVFAKMTDMWPIGHSRAAENATAPLTEDVDTITTFDGETLEVVDDDDKPKRKPIDWSRF